jgi:ubiquinone biosynthesis monooxygenase Coq7
MPIEPSLPRNLPGEPAGAKLSERIVRVDHAGEYGAKRIYEGQLAVLGETPSGDGSSEKSWRAACDRQSCTHSGM